LALAFSYLASWIQRRRIYGWMLDEAAEVAEGVRFAHQAVLLEPHDPVVLTVETVLQAIVVARQAGDLQCLAAIGGRLRAALRGARAACSAAARCRRQVPRRDAAEGRAKRPDKLAATRRPRAHCFRKFEEH